jgi:hypothetical protein
MHDQPLPSCSSLPQHLLLQPLLLTLLRLLH